MDHDRETVKHQSDEALESQIVSARAALRHDVMLLEEKVSPSAIVDRRKRRMQAWMGDARLRARERMSGLRSEARSLQQEVEEKMEHGMSETRSKIPGRAITGIRESSYSRPLLFAGLAFLAGWGISRAMPMTRSEERLASKVAPVVEEKAGPIVGEAKTAVTESAREAMLHREG